MKILESSLKGKEMLWEKEKLLVKSNFSLSRRVFKTLVLQGLVSERIKQVISSMFDNCILHNFSITGIHDQQTFYTIAANCRGS